MIRKIYPHLSEKSTILASEGQFVFLVDRNASKGEIKDEIETLFDVEVDTVRTIRLPQKKRFFKRQKGTVGRLKKAIVTLSKGKIPFFEGV